ncbi:anthranilate synthase component 1 [Alteribacillus persepolensis]|uniref:Anthranilate synthase component 1 n=1 Tax=Alteribacillus persepolensis TaxID=568899 RepID=A0A1G7ZFH5_9BACI|nr:anthranilate synthase component I [Alteribacillus persepolensis]SDH07533.1 anthranilate synthase component 1 [Alteribacillus persepolensis]
MTETSFQAFQELSKTSSMLPYVRRFFTDTLTPIQVFQKLKDKAVFLLESKDEASPWSRYSFIGLSPQYKIYSNKNMYVFADKNDRVLLQSENLAELFEQSITWLKPGSPSIQIPFKGGAVGVIPYDTVEEFEPELKSSEDTDRADEVVLLFCETLIALDHDTKEISFIHYDNDIESGTKKRYEQAKATVGSLMEQVAAVTGADAFLSPLTTTVDVHFKQVSSNYPKQKFLQDVETIKEYIKAGDIFQAVLSQRFEKHITVTAFDIYRTLRMINPSPYMFYLKLGDTEVVGSSPERLIQVQDNHVEIHPIAGTRKRGATKQEDDELVRDLLQDEKEKAEHYMLVDLARNDVGRVAEYGSVDTPVLLEIGKFSHVMHIISKVTGTISHGTKPIAALEASFPAGTVSGAPKFRAMQILKELEPERRGIYAGAVCYLGFDGNIDSCIAIRTMIVKNNKAKIQAGAGIVADSIPEKEYEETQNKAAALLKAIESAEEMFSREREEEESIHA